MGLRHRIVAIAFFALAAGGAVLASGFLPGDPGWAVAGIAASSLYAIVGVLLWRQVAWAGAVALGMAGFSVGLWIQSTIALATAHGGQLVGGTTLDTCIAGLGASAIGFALPWLLPRAVSWRHGAAIAFAGASLVPGLLFALAPAQSLGVAIAMGLGSATLLAGTVAVGRGRTWGLLLDLVGAAIVGIGVAFAPAIGTVAAVNPYVPNCGGFLVDVLGITAASLAAASTAVYVGPLVRFVVRG